MKKKTYQSQLIKQMRDDRLEKKKRVKITYRQKTRAEQEIDIAMEARRRQ